MQPIRTAIVVPCFNHGPFVGAVVRDALRHGCDCIAVNDGSTDNSGEVLGLIPGIHIMNLVTNRGKGAALREAFAEAFRRGYTHVITIDADGQHQSEDIPLFLEKIRLEPDTLWIGDRSLPVAGDAGPPLRSRFGRRFGAFWFRFHTGVHIHDTQCGLRAYPLERVLALGCRGNRYEFEIEVLIQAAWNGIAVRQIPVHLYYPGNSLSVSHFRTVQDFFRISVINSKAAIARIFLPASIRSIPGPGTLSKIRYLVLHELQANSSPVRAAASLSLGVAVGISPFHGFQMLILLSLSFILKINRPLTFLGVSISSPPLIPFWIAAGLATGRFVVPESILNQVKLAVRATVPYPARATILEHLGGLAGGIVEWAIGSLVLSALLGAVSFFVTVPVFRAIQHRRKQHDSALPLN